MTSPPTPPEGQPAWPPRGEDGLHGATYEWDCTIGAAPLTVVRCICGFYRIAESDDVAKREYMNHIRAAAGVGGKP